MLKYLLMTIEEIKLKESVDDEIEELMNVNIEGREDIIP